ncbi:MAG TPA: hypothetical protein VN622_08630 [Clostridia bacterium]|nr:hypothetical protein [Clostridia bacterium]
MLNRTKYREQHPDDGILLAYLDCEQPEHKQAEVRDHLESCWTCRARLGKLEDTISSFIDFRDQAFSAESMQPPQQFRGFSFRLSRLIEEPIKENLWVGALRAVSQSWERVVHLRLASGWLAPSVMFALLLAIAITLSLRGREKDTLPSGTSLLAQSAWADTIGQTQLLRRTLIVEQKDATTGRVVRHRRIESWKSGSGPRAVRRVYDENNAMIAGTWTKTDGSRVEYQPKMGDNASQPEERLPEGGSVWDLSPSASEFGRLVGADAQLTVQATPALYVVGYANTSNKARSHVRSASLTLRRRDLHAVEQVLVIEEHSAISEYRIAETEYERRNFETADARYFEPDTVAHAKAAPPEPPPPPLFVPATLDDEVQLIGGLDSVGALVGEQIEISYLPSGALKLRGLIPTAQRRDEILRGLGGLAHSPAVKVELATLDEAQSRDTNSTPVRLRLDEIEIAHTSFPAEADLRAYLSAAGTADQDVAGQAYRISSAALEHAGASREHAIALQRIAASFTPEQVGAMSGDARAQWEALVHKHVTELAQQLRQMRAGVGPVFGVPPPQAQHVRPPHPENLWDAVRQLNGLVASIDEGVRRSFTVRENGPGGAPVKQQEFWDWVDSAIALADKASLEMTE